MGPTALTKTFNRLTNKNILNQPKNQLDLHPSP
jgi:hypothetical protein